MIWAKGTLLTSISFTLKTSPPARCRWGRVRTGSHYVTSNPNLEIGLEVKYGCKTPVSCTSGKWMVYLHRVINDDLHIASIYTRHFQKSSYVLLLFLSFPRFSSGLKRDLPPAPLPRWVLPEHGGSPARAGGAPERQPVLRQGLLKRRKTENSVVVLD